ncbi:MAG: FHA domain-containing serine/threonine-protein kinase [Planctomycetota bacterium]|nr:FHA domain-containing serine/threonine-protein kinase [Planctomycetota bacterium]
MAELTVESGPLRGQTLSFNQDDTFLVGSGEDCTLRLEGPGIADQHLVIKALKNGGFGIKMLKGPFTLNGKESEAARLRDGDLIELADTRLRFGPKKLATKEKDLGSLGGYRMSGVLGRGGHGTVYRAEQMSLHRNVALKVLPKETTQNAEFVGRFVAEARAAARLSHPNVVQVFDVGHDGDTYFLSMEIMENGSLEDRLKREGKLPWQECLQLMVDAAQGLAYAESMRIVHRDIKPDNLMVDSHGTVKIADLGLAMSDDEEQGKIVGTPHFMSPEQATGKPLDHRSDLYSLGCTFFRLVTGRPLFQRSKTKEILRAHVNDEPESADQVNSEVPSSVAACIGRLVEKDPDDRYQSADDLIANLDQLLHPPARRGPLIAALAVLLLGAGFVIYYLATKEPTIITKTNGDPAKTATLERQLREQRAETERGRILRNEENLEPLQLADRFDEFAAKSKYKATPAAISATAKAKDLRREEAARIAAAKARASAVKVARANIERTVRGLINQGKFQAALGAMKPDNVSDEVLNDPGMVEAVATLRNELKTAAKASLDQLTKAIDDALSSQKPDAMELAIAGVEAILDKNSGWPAEALTDRAGLIAFLRTKKQEVKSLRSTLASSRESSAKANFYRLSTSDEGVMAAVRNFDLARASKLASDLHGELDGFEIQPSAAHLLGVVQAAASYWTDFQAAVAAGTLHVTLEIDNDFLDVVVKGFDPKTGLQIDHSDQASVPLDRLRTNGLHQVFKATKADKQHGENRLAFLALHALAEHMAAAKVYLSNLDPTKPETGTGEKRYAETMLDLNYVVRATRKIDASWKKFLSHEVQASNALARGLRAFSMLQYTRAHGYLEDLRDRYQDSLVIQITR